MIHGTMLQQPWTTTRNGSTHQQLSEKQTSPILLLIISILIFGEQTNSLKSTILTPNSGYHFLHSMLCKVIYFVLLCTFEAKVTTCKTIVYVIEILSKVVSSTPIAIYKWFNKPRIRHTKKHCKSSNGSGKFSHNLRASKKSCHNKRNCKSGIQGR